MLVQYLVGLCCLRRNPDAVHVELGALVVDDVLGKKRDVDVTVTVRDDSGEGWAFKAFEVKNEKSSLDVTVVEQLCGKLNDMSSVTHRAIVSSSGFSDSAKRKAEHYGIDLYTLDKWATPIDVEFSRFGLKGLPEDAIPLRRKLLVWVGWKVSIVAPAAQRDFNVKDTDPLLDSTGAPHPRYRAFSQYREEILLRSTEALYLREPAQTMGRTLPEFHVPGLSITAEWPHTHTLDVSADDVYIRVDDLVKIKEITISGYMRWESKSEQPDFRVMRRVRDREPFAGALIALGRREGQMFVFVMSDRRDAGIHFVQLEERHLNMIRQLSVPLPAQNEVSES
jgi:Restriction endonuclease